MSTICKLALVAPAERVVQAVEAHLRGVDWEFARVDSTWPLAGERETFLVSDHFPTILSLKQATVEVTEIHFNSFCRLEELASRLSDALGADVVVNIYQSCSTASYWAFHSKGRRLRSIEAGDGFVASSTGEPLPFEGPEPGREYEDDGARFVRFDAEAQNCYNASVSVPVEIYQDHEAGWINLIQEPQRSSEAAAGFRRKPWWRLW